MRISEVTARSGVPATTLRYYEDLGLITSRRAVNLLLSRGAAEEF